MSLAFIDGAEHQMPIPPLLNTATSPISYVTPGRYGTGYYYRSGYLIWDVPTVALDPEIWVGAAIVEQTFFGGTLRPIITLYGDGLTVTHLSLYLSTAGVFNLYRGTSSGTLLASGASGMAANVWECVELYGLIDDTVGAYEVRVNGVTIFSGSGVDTRNGGTSANVSAFRISGAENNFIHVDDVYCVTGDGTGASGFQGEITVEGIVPNGNGNYSQLVGQDGDSTNNYLNVDERPFSTTDYNGSPTAGNKDTYAYSNLVATTGNILGSMIHYGAFKNAAGFIKGRRVIRLSAADYAGADTPALSGTLRYFTETLENSPATAAAWTISEVNGLEAGFEVRSA